MDVRKQQGFTLIELIIVIIILGVLSAVALPRFIDFSTDAENATLEAAASRISSAMSVNYAACALDGQDASTDRCVRINPTSYLDACSLTMANRVLANELALPDGYMIAVESALTFPSSRPDGTTLNCAIIRPHKPPYGIVARYTVILAGNHE